MATVYYPHGGSRQQMMIPGTVMTGPSTQVFMGGTPVVNTMGTMPVMTNQMPMSMVTTNQMPVSVVSTNQATVPMMTNQCMTPMMPTNQVMMGGPIMLANSPAYYPGTYFSYLRQGIWRPQYVGKQYILGPCLSILGGFLLLSGVLSFISLSHFSLVYSILSIIAGTILLVFGIKMIRKTNKDLAELRSKQGNYEPYGNSPGHVYRSDQTQNNQDTYAAEGTTSTSQYTEQQDVPKCKLGPTVPLPSSPQYGFQGISENSPSAAAPPAYNPNWGDSNSYPPNYYTQQDPSLLNKQTNY